MLREVIMKKLGLIVVVVFLIAITATVLPSCEADKLFESYWELVAVENQGGSLIAYGENYYPESVLPHLNITCTLGVGENITIDYPSKEKQLFGKMNEIKTGIDNTKTYSIVFNDGRIGILNYIDIGEILPSDDYKSLSGLVVTIGEEYILYFVRK